MEKGIFEVKEVNAGIAVSEIPNAERMLIKAEDLQIKTQADYELAAGLMKEAKERLKVLETERKKITIPLDATKNAVQALFKKPKAFYERAVDEIGRLMIKYDDDMEAKRLEAEMRLRQKAEEERKKMLERAQAAEQKGKEVKAEQLREKAEAITAPVVGSSIEKPECTSYRIIYSGEVEDKTLVPLDYLEPDMVKINKVISATKGSVPIPGIRVVQRKVVVSR